ncbi:hypothetical protein DFH06DRAFT_1164106 [Mycena polygramma]|nr:hypothetical protein DFH06DRAFT_1164106 [Mycena polygramma]
MDQNGFDFNALRMNTAPTNPPPFSMLQRAPNSRKPFSFIQTQSRNNPENQPTTRMPQPSASGRRQVESLRMKQEPNESNAMFPHARQQQPTLIPQPRNETKPQSNKLRAFTMAYDEHRNSSLDPPQYFSSPKPSFKVHSEIHDYTRSAPSQEPSVQKSRSPSLAFDQDFDAEDADLSQLMTKRMREAKLIKSKLAEQRLATAALESRLSAQTAASDASDLALKTRIAELEAREAKSGEELRGARSQIDDTERKLRDATKRLDELRTAAKSGLADAQRNYTALQDLKSEYDASQAAVTRLSDELAQIRQDTVDSVKGIEDSTRSVETRALIEELQNDRASAHQVVDMLRDKLHLLSAQVVEARERVAELEAVREGKIDRVEARVEELTERLVKKEEEGARELASAEALQARLHETNERLLRVSKALEEREVELGSFRQQKVAWEWEMKEKCAKIASLQSLSADIVVLKEENITLECQVKEIKEEKIVLECQAKEDRSKISALQISQTELVAVRAENVALECAAKENRSKLAALEDLQRVTSAKLQTAQEQCVHLRGEVKALENVREQLHSSLEASQATETRLTQESLALTREVNSLTLREAVLQEREAVLQQKSGELAAQVSTLNSEASAREDELKQVNTKCSVLQERFDAQALTLKLAKEESGGRDEELKQANTRCSVLQERFDTQALAMKLAKEQSGDREEELRQVNTKCSVLQERFDSQALTLKLAKEQSGDLQERLLVSESSHATKLESAVGKLNLELAVLREQKANLQATLNQVTEEAATQRAGFLGASVDYENKLSKQEETHSKLALAEERRAAAAERDAADAKRQVDELVRQVESGRAELEDVRLKAREAASRESVDIDGEVVVLRARLEEVEGENSKLQHRARILNQRYKDGDLSDSEKSFVNSLMQMSQSIHEQDIVAKEIELRRRENMITAHQTRIDTLESTLARLLKERGKEGGPNSKSMVDLSLWMSSSPRSADKKPAMQPAAASTSNRIQPPSPTVFVPDTPPVKKSSKAPKPAVKMQQPSPSTHRAHKTFAALDAEEPLTDSDDDMPISAKLGKRSRTPTLPDDEPNRPARRLRAAASRKVDPESRKTDGESSKKVRNLEDYFAA